MNGQLITTETAVPAKCQHKVACADCPWGRKSLPGWLGGNTADEWVQFAHSDAIVECHTLTGAQCAGIAIYRRNVVKRVVPPNMKLEADHEKVFSTPMEFKDHHKRFMR